MKIEELSCTNCGAPLLESAISVQLKAARCSHCNSIFSLESHGVPGEQEDAPLPPLPQDFLVIETEDHLEIAWRWFRFHHVLFFLFGIPWTGFSLFWMDKASRGPIFLFLFGLPFVAVGVGMLYFALSGFVNSTTLSASKEQLRISHAPLPWLTPPQIHPGNIKQFYCRLTVSKHDSDTSCSYTLYVVLTSGRHIKLISLDDYDSVHALERKIEKFLKIDDTRVPGEYNSK